MRFLFTAAVAIFVALCLSTARAGEADPELISSVKDGDLELQIRDGAVKMLSKSKEGAQALLKMAEKGEFPEEMKSSAALALAESEDAAVRNAAAKMLPLPKMKDGKQIQPVSKLTEMKGDSRAGRAVFRDGKGPNCINCHQIENEGKEIGPPLNNIGEKPKEALYESILAPSAAIQHGFETWTVKTKSGKVLTGVRTGDPEDKITLKTAEGEFVEIPADEIQRQVKQKASLMPENLIQTMTTKDLIDLVEYLSEQKVNK